MPSLNLPGHHECPAIDDSFLAHTEEIAITLLGQPNSKKSQADNVRFGTNGSLSIKISTGEWFDHESKEGGTIFSLIERELNVTRAGAIEWLKSKGLASSTGSTVTSNAANSNRKDRRLEFVYEDETGTPALKVTRIEHADGSKSFFQSTYAEGGWKAGTRGQPTPIYHLPAVKEAIKQRKTVFVVEGEKCVQALSSFDCVATCNAGGANNWKPHHSAALKGANVVVIPDNDDAGRKHAETVASGLAQIANSVVVVSLPGLPEKGDIADWIETGGTHAQLEELIAKAQTSVKAERYPWPVLVGNEITACVAPDFVIKDLLFLGDLSIVYGQPKSGKTFFTLDLAAHVATGKKYRTHETKQGAVVYVAGEGARGLKLRLEAWKHFHGIDFDQIPFAMVDGAPRLRGDDCQALPLVQLVLDHCEKLNAPPTLIVIDTLARSFNGGNENAADDMSQFVDGCKVLQSETGAHVLVVHHQGKNSSNGMRGSSALLGAADLVLKITKDNDICNAEIEAAKDIAATDVGAFTLEFRRFGEFNDGSPKQSVVAVPTEPRKKRQKLSNKEKLALDELKQLVEAEGQTPPVKELPNGVKVVSLQEWRQILNDRAITGQGASQRSAWKRLLDALQQKSVIRVHKDYVWLL